MHKQIIFIFLICILTAFACKEETKKAEERDPLLEKIGGDYYQDIIRTPVNADGSIDTTNLPKIVFDNKIHDFGTLGTSDKKEHKFNFTNKGTSDLILLNVKTTCGCTVAAYDEKPIKPNGTGEIIINYDPTGKEGLQEKNIIVTSNTFPNKTELTIIAEIIKE